MAKRTLKQRVEHKFGKLAYFMIHAVLEWILMGILFVDGLIALAANEFARYFELEMPCLLCTRIDHVFVHRDPDFYYNDSICESHRKDVSSKAYCHVHRRLSDIKRMCEGCLLSFATENKPSCDPYKSLMGILGADHEFFADDNNKIHFNLPAGVEEDCVEVEKSSVLRCSCCGEPLKVKTQTLTLNGGNVAQAPLPSPKRLNVVKNEGSRGFDLLPNIKYADSKPISNTNSEISKEEVISTGNQGEEDAKAVTVPLLTESKDLSEDSCKTPHFLRSNRFFDSTDSATCSPRWLPRLPRKHFAEKADSTDESLEGTLVNNADGETILDHLKRQVRLDRKSLIALYLELDEERSASAVAAHQAMAMITRLQAEKAAMQMEALQYQRLMEEQAEYDQEALQDMKDLLNKKEEEIQALEEELEMYRQRFECEDEQGDDDYKELKRGSVSSMSGSCTPNLGEDTENDGRLEPSSTQAGPSW